MCKITSMPMPIVLEAAAGTPSEVLKSQIKWMELIIGLIERLGDGEVSQADLIWILAQLWDDFNPAWAKMIQEMIAMAQDLAEFVRDHDMSEFANIVAAMSKIAALLELIERLQDAISGGD